MLDINLTSPSGEHDASVSESERQDSFSHNSQTLTMGIDFGTAFTKVVIRASETAFASEYIYAVNFESLSKTQSSCLLQTALWTYGESTTLEKRDNFECVTDMKIGIIESRTDSKSREETVSYLALAIRHSRKQFEEVYGKSNENINTIWKYNIGIPAAVEQEETQEIRRVYHLIGNAAAILAESSDSISIQTARCSIQKAKSLGHLSCVAFVPEVVAQAVGYVNSVGAIDGLAVITDVGAWTLDTCAFILMNTNLGSQAQFHVNAAKVDSLGCIPLHRERVTAIEQDISFDASLPMLPPESYSQITSEVESVRSIDECFSSKCNQHVRMALDDAKRSAQDERVFIGEAGITFIICGGGYHAQPFKDVQKAAWEKYISHGGIRHGSVERATYRTIPKPGDLDADGINNDNYHRLSVAWGLSYPDIKYTLPDGTVVEPTSGISFPSFDDRGFD